MRLLRSSLVGGSAPKPPGFFRFFQARISILVSVEGDRLRLSPTIPATEPVARVASQQRSIPSASAWLIINYVVRALYKKPANGHSPLNFVSHVLGSPHSGIPPPRPTPCPQQGGDPKSPAGWNRVSDGTGTSAWAMSRLVQPVGPIGSCLELSA